MLRTSVLGSGIRCVVKSGEKNVLLETERGTVSAIVDGDTGGITVQFDNNTIEKKLDVGEAYSTAPKPVDGIKSTRESVWFIRSKV